MVGQRGTQPSECPHYDNPDESAIFTLKIRHGGRVQQTEPVTYVGGQIQYFDYVEVDELGYNRNESKLYGVVGDGLIEIVTDNEAWDLIDFENKSREVEVWMDNDLGFTCESERQVSGDGEETDNEDCDYEVEEEGKSDDIEFDRAVDPNVEYHGIGSSCNVKDRKTQRISMNVEVNFSDEGTPHGSDEELEDDIWPQFRHCDIECPTFTVGMTFGTKSEFKEAIINYAFNEGKDLKFVKNDKIRLVANCKQTDCPLSITLRLIENVNTWRISAFNDNHVGCSWVYENKMVSSSRLAKKWKKEIGSHSDWKVSEFRKRVATNQGFHISQKVAYKAMTFARASLTGEMEDYFKKFWSYYLEIQRSNPNTTSIVKMSESIENGGKKRFLRWYICWEACRVGFKHCRKIIGVDGCHLRFKYGGYLLTATTMDPNDGIFPIAYALAEGENKESWSWFLSLLKHDLGISELEQHRYTFVSDKQKGLIPAFQSILPNVSHRFCVRHLFSNMKVAGFQGKAIKETLWAAARATTVNSFTEAMRKMKGLDIKAFEWLGDKHPSEWSRSHFGTDALCDILVNNISECFNSMLVDARSYPLISCLEKMRTILMMRLFKNKQEATKWTGRICPTILKKIAVQEKYAGSYLPIQCDLLLFEITGLHTSEQHKIDLGKRTCSCRKWDLTGIPCKHAICAIWMKKHDVIDYVDKCYMIQTYLKVYGAAINPMDGPKEWPMTHREPPLPPLFKPRPSRPKKLRKTGRDEISKDGIHVSRKHVPLHCTFCKKSGHNVRKCPLKPKHNTNTAVRGNRNPKNQPRETPMTERLSEVQVGVDNSTTRLETMVQVSIEIVDNNNNGPYVMPVETEIIDGNEEGDKSNEQQVGHISVGASFPPPPKRMKALGLCKQPVVKMRPTI